MTDDDKFPSQLAERFQIRMPDGLRDQLREAAEANSRSMNAEIVWRLMQSLGDAPEGPAWTLHVPEDLQKRVAIAAQKHGVSPNDEVLNLLRDFYPAPKTAADAAREIERLADVLSPASSVPEIEQLVRKMQDLAISIYKGRVPEIPQDVRYEVEDRYVGDEIDDMKEMARAPYGSDDV